MTSLVSGDGKSTVVSNLAIAMAQSGHRTIVVDADFRKPSQHEIFQTPTDHGLTTVLAGRDKLSDVIHSTPIAHLYVLPCGPIPKFPSEMLHGKVFAQVMRHLPDSFEYVVVDSPPVMPIVDARILGAICDTTLLVLRAGRVTIDLADQARDGLLSVGAHLVGSVVNAVSPRDARYGYSPGHGRYWRRSRYGDGGDRPRLSDGPRPDNVDNTAKQAY